MFSLEFLWIWLFLLRISINFFFFFVWCCGNPRILMLTNTFFDHNLFFLSFNLFTVRFSSGMQSLWLWKWKKKTKRLAINKIKLMRFDLPCILFAVVGSCYRILVHYLLVNISILYHKPDKTIISKIASIEQNKLKRFIVKI